ncbi:MAG: MGMT family protein [Chloracidobacterium sp.]|nr:MGMT family protein [Chloracidobacterium sp.]
MDRKPIANAAKDSPQDEPSFRERVYELVLRIPAGRVMSYGLVARVLGAGYDARAIGNVMHATPDDGRNIPWHRVINAQGGCSTAGFTTPPDLQERLLDAEGVVFDEKGRCRIEKYSWTPPEYEEDTKRENENQGDLFSIT